MNDGCIWLVVLGGVEGDGCILRVFLIAVSCSSPASGPWRHTETIRFPSRATDELFMFFYLLIDSLFDCSRQRIESVQQAS